jgi:hypothetical protein
MEAAFNEGEVFIDKLLAGPFDVHIKLPGT